MRFEVMRLTLHHFFFCWQMIINIILLAIPLLNIFQQATHKGELGYGDVYTWTALCADTKLIPSFMVGKRDSEYGNAFMLDLASRLKNRVQLTTDGHRVYLNAVENAFGSEIDYAMLVKVYGKGTQEDERSYSPAVCTGAELVPIR